MLRRLCQLIFFAVVFTGLAGVALGQQNLKSDPIIKLLDKNSNGVLDSQEIESAPRLLKQVDQDRDGSISQIEVGLDSGKVIGRSGGQRGQGGKNGGSRLGGYQDPPPANEVPKHPFNIITGRLTDRSATVRVMVWEDARCFLEYGVERDNASDKTQIANLKSGVPFDFILEMLEKDTRYYYRLVYQAGNVFRKSVEYLVQTQRSVGKPFVFTVQADSHLDENTSGEVYLRTLANASVDRPDFHFALGDTFMTGKYLKPELSQPQYLAQRYYLGHLCHSAGLYFALGNHDGESGNRGSHVWATTTRKRYIPNPSPDGFYSGNSFKETRVGFPENYYEFEWGDAQFIVLDPFRHTVTRGKNDNWYWTLGEAQYGWLERSLQQSEAKFCFVFLHHLVGVRTVTIEVVAKRLRFGSGVERGLQVRMNLKPSGLVGRSQFISC